MNTLADAIIESLLHISTAPGDEERADADATALGEISSILQKSSDAERKALTEALNRAKVKYNSSPEFIDTFRAIQEDIIEACL